MKPPQKSWLRPVREHVPAELAVRVDAHVHGIAFKWIGMLAAVAAQNAAAVDQRTGTLVNLQLPSRRPRQHTGRAVGFSRAAEKHT